MRAALAGSAGCSVMLAALAVSVSAAVRKHSHGKTVVGGNVMGGGAVGASGAVQATYTSVKPLGGRYSCQ